MQPRNTIVSISKGNSKMGAIMSVSLPAWKTCPNFAPCKKGCYAAKIERLRPNVRNSYARNLEILMLDPESYWRQVEAAIMTSRYFRFHVAGDIPRYDYLVKMCEVAARNSHCEILCFTKRHDYVNQYIDNGGIIPANLHLLLSGWKGMKMINPHNLPEAHVLFRDGTTTAREDAIPCGGNCTECARTDGGCWALKKGQQILLKEH